MGRLNLYIHIMSYDITNKFKSISQAEHE